MKTWLGMMVLMGAAALSACGGAAVSNGGNPPGPGPAPAPGPTPVGARFAYVLSQADLLINQYAIGSDGALSPQAVPTVNVGTYPTSMVMDTTQSYVYVSNSADQSISQFRIGDDGGLVELASSPLAAEAMGSLAVSPSGTYLYGMGWWTDSILVYSIGSDGQLALQASVPSPGTPLSMTFAPDGHFAYVVQLQTNAIAQFSVGVDGGLTPLTPASVSGTGCPTGPITAARASSGGSTVYALSCSDNLVDVFAIGADGTLSLGASVPTGLSPQGMAISGSGLYVANGCDSTVSMFAIGPDGSLSAMAQPVVSAGVSPETLAVDAVKGRAFVLDYDQGQVLHYAVRADGTLAPSGAAPVGTGALPGAVLLR